MNLTYTVVLRKTADTSIFVRTVMSTDRDGKTAEARAVAAVIALAGEGYVAQSINLQPVDIDLT